MAPSGALPSTKAPMFPLIQSVLIHYLTHGYQPPTYALFFFIKGRALLPEKL